MIPLSPIGFTEISYHDLQFKQIPITMHSSRGTKYTRWVDIGVPKIPIALIDSVFYLYRNRSDAENGANYGGTGFIVAVLSEKFPDKYVYVYGVTNWHIVLRDGCSVMRLNTLDSKNDIFEFEPTEWEWIPGQDDVAVSPEIQINIDLHAAQWVSTNLFATEERIAKNGIGVGDDVFMVGRFINHDGGPTNSPAVRFGNISVMPTPIVQPNGYRGRSYCIDLHSRTGYSGSPVFVFRTPGNDLDESFRTGRISISGGFLALLGIHWGQFPELWEVTGSGELSETARQGLITEGKYIKGMSGMTCVIPAYKILELLNTKKLKDKRMEGDAQLG